MDVKRICLNIIDQLVDLVNHLDDKTYTLPVPSLSYSSLGQHLRHTIEFFFCLEQGYVDGVVNYDKRAHDKQLETERMIALASLRRIGDFVEKMSGEKCLKLEVSYEMEGDRSNIIESNAIRELVYNIEHAVHHMAIMKIGVREVAPHVVLPAGFGVAASTLRHKQSAA